MALPLEIWLHLTHPTHSLLSLQVIYMYHHMFVCKFVCVCAYETCVFVCHSLARQNLRPEGEAVMSTVYSRIEASPEYTTVLF
jgi:hypothetical protein